MVVFLSQQIPEVCWIVQELANEARSMMWAMVGNNVAVLGAFLHCNLEDVNGPARVDAEHPKIFSSILVGPLTLNEHSTLLTRIAWQVWLRWRLPLSAARERLWVAWHHRTTSTLRPPPNILLRTPKTLVGKAFCALGGLCMTASMRAAHLHR